MRVSNIQNNNTQFKSHSYKIQPKSEKLIIQTDNNPYLGDKPYIVTSDYPDKEVEMNQDNRNFYQSVPIKNKDLSYHIIYKDTGAIDTKNGEDYKVDTDFLQQKASFYLRKKHNQPIIHAIKSGTAKGKLITKDKIGLSDNSFINSLKEPTILLTKKFHHNLSNPNIVGIIYTSDDAGSFSHIATQLRTRTDACGTVFDNKIVSNLKKFEGQNIELQLKDNFIKFNKIENTKGARKYPNIEVPELEYSDKILTSKEYTPNLVGAKALNLAKLERLSKDKKINAIIPKSIALPFGYIDNLLKQENEQPFYENKNSQNQIDNILETMKENNINTDKIMVRSSFNGEDLPNYSAAGIYNSFSVNMSSDTDELTNKEFLFYSIQMVAESKNWDNAVISRKRYNIPDEKIQPTVLLQEQVDEDYKFTLYTDDKNGNLKIDLFSDENWNNEETTQPHVFTYNKKDKTLKYNSIQMNDSSVTFDEKMNIIDSDPIKNDLSNNKKLFKVLKSIIKDALVIEKEFKAPQDIEGGIKGNQTYIWQTRNIVD